jgi:serine/threonine protein kinase
MSDYDLVLSGKRPDVSDEPPWMRELLNRCWDEDPHQRPGWDEILEILGKELVLRMESDLNTPLVSCACTDTLPEEEDPSGEETNVNEEDEQAMTRGGVEAMYSGSARKREWTETLREEEDPSGEETSVNEEDEQAMIRGGLEPMYSGSAPKCEWTETLREEEDPSGEETSVNEDKEPTTSGKDPSSKEDEEATTSGGVTSGGVFSGTEPKRYWTLTLPAKEEDPRRRRRRSGVETGVNEEDDKLCFPLVRQISPSELKIVRKLAEGGQAKIFVAKYLKTGQDVVVKRYRNCQVQARELRRQMERLMEACEKRHESGLCRVIGVSVDEKGRVSTVMQLMQGDLQNFINHNPFLDYVDRLGLMKAIASGIKELHGCGFIHKDLKASNILLSRLPNRGFPLPGYTRSPQHFLHDTPNYRYLKVNLDRDRMVYDIKCGEILVKVGDYESSDGVLGTGFFRAPEVLRALRDGDGRKFEYKPAVDVYGFGMVCYELLTGKYPFPDHRTADYDLVLSGKRPDVSDEPPWMRELLHRCWDEDPHQRPGWDEILQILGKELVLRMESDLNTPLVSCE